MARRVEAEEYLKGDNSEKVRYIWSAWLVDRGIHEMYQMVRGFLEHGRVDLKFLFEINFNNSPTEIFDCIQFYFKSHDLYAGQFFRKTVEIWRTMDDDRKSILTSGDITIEDEYDRFVETLESKLNDPN